MHKFDTVYQLFEASYGKPAISVAAAGRANIIGEHTDYHEGFVLPFAIDAAIYFCAKQGNSNAAEIISLDFDEKYDANVVPVKGSWQLYVHGLLSDLKTRFQIIATPVILFGGNLPMGAGVSSSSALCCGLIEVVNILYDLGLTAIEKVKWASEIEHGTGVRGGKMDQYAICHGQAGKAMLLDCRSLSHKDISLPETWQFLLLNTGVKHNLAFTAYNQRRQEAEDALAELNKHETGLVTLRDATVDQVNHWLEKGSLYHRRALHVVTENKRVAAFELCAQMGDIRNAGRLMNQSHESLQNQYEVSCEELDFLQQQAAKCNSIYGSRIMGGGFGGCTISLIQEVDERDISNIRQAYLKKFGLLPDYFTVHPAPGLVHYG